MYSYTPVDVNLSGFIIVIEFYFFVGNISPL